MTAFYMFRLWFMTFSGREGSATATSHGESPRSMTAPLVILAVFAAFFGFMMMFGWENAFGIRFDGFDWTIGTGTLEFTTEHLKDLFTNYQTYITIALVLIAILLAYLMYSTKQINPGKINANGRAPLYRIVARRWYFPELYNQVSWKLGYGVAKVVDYTDRNIIDGSVNGLANAVIGSGESVAKAQDGHVSSYAAVVLAGVIGFFVVVAVILYAYGVI